VGICQQRIAPAHAARQRQLTRAAYVEFDLEAMLSAIVRRLFLAVAHLPSEPRRGSPSIPPVGGTEEGVLAGTLVERGGEQGARALDALRDGVQDAITALGRGFLAQPPIAISRLNSNRRTDRAGLLSPVVRLVYRLIFLFVAKTATCCLSETPRVWENPWGLYTWTFIRPPLRRMAEALRGGRTPISIAACGEYSSCCARLSDLGLPALGAFSFPSAPRRPGQHRIANSAMLEGIRALAFTIEAGCAVGGLQEPRLDRAGSVYESLLELHPILNADAATFDMTTGAATSARRPARTIRTRAGERVNSRARWSRSSRSASETLRVKRQTSNVRRQDGSHLTFDSSRLTFASYV